MKIGSFASAPHPVRSSKKARVKVAIDAST
jgi:hypothetical protein